MMGHMLMFSFEEKRKQWKVNVKNLDPTDMTEVEVSMHSILIRGINRDVPIK